MSFDLITIGNVCVDLFVPEHERPPSGGIALIPSLSLAPGGNGANTAVTAARFGARSALAGRIGDDVFGDYLARFLAGEGVDTALLEVHPELSTPTTLVFNDDTGERSFVHSPGTNATFALSPAVTTADCPTLHFAAPELLGSWWPDGAVDTARRAKERGTTRVSLDLFVSPDMSPAELAESHREILALTDVALPNEPEALAVTGTRDVDSAIDALHGAGVPLVVVKRGAAGAVVSESGRRTLVRTASVRALDTCGAGDSFAGAFLVGLSRGLEPARAAEFGCAVGTACVEEIGSLTATARDDVLAAFHERFPFLTAGR